MHKLRSSAVVVAVAIALLPGPAKAFDSAAVVAAIVTLGTTMTLIIRETVAEAAVGLGGVVQSQQAAIARMLDGKTAQDMDLQKRGDALEVTLNSRAPINECRTATIGSQQGAAAAVKMRAARNELERFTELRMLAQDPAAEARRIVRQHLTQYAGAQDVTFGWSRGKAALPNADILATSLLDGAGAAEDRQQTFNPQQAAAARAFVENAFGGALNGVSAGRRPIETEADARIAALLLSREAAMSLPRYVAKEVLASRLPVVGLGDALHRIQSTMMSTPPERKQNVSESEVLSTEANRRYANPAWYGDVAAMQTPIQVQKETLHAIALLVAQTEKMRQAQERTNLLLAQLTAISADSAFRAPMAEATRTNGR